MTSEIKPRIVYKLLRTDVPENGTDVYVGSTSRDLKARLREHKHNTKRCTSKLYTRIREVGAENWEILPLVICPCDHEEIRTLEQQWVELLKPDLNALSPLRENNEKNRNSAKNHYRDSLRTRRYFCYICNIAFGNKCNQKFHYNSEKHKDKSLEQLIEGVHEMIKNGTFAQALENSKETSL